MINGDPWTRKWDQSSQVTRALGVRITWETAGYSHPPDQRRLESLRGAGEWGEVEGSPCFFLFGKSPVSSASQNTWNREGQGSYHPVVQHPVQQRGMVVVLAIQVLAHNLDVSLLAHLLS